jgi:hypothetical protein
MALEPLLVILISATNPEPQELLTIYSQIAAFAKLPDSMAVIPKANLANQHWFCNLLINIEISS